MNIIIIVGNLCDEGWQLVHLSSILIYVYVGIIGYE